jgi:hypothetical protein
MGLDRAGRRLLLDSVSNEVFRTKSSTDEGSSHFGFVDSEVKTVNSVLGYTPNVPHWGWDGNARRYWDFV